MFGNSMLMGGNAVMPTEGLFLHYDASKADCYAGTGTIVTDLSGNGRHATLIGGTAHADGSFVLDGTDDYLRVQATMPLATATYSIKVKGNENISRGFLETGGLNLLKSTNPQLLLCSTIPNYQLLLAVYHDANKYIYPSTYQKDVWYNITVSRINGGAEKVYVNGILLNTRNTQAYATAATQMNIGVGYQGFWKGNISFLAVYNRILTDDEVLSIL